MIGIQDTVKTANLGLRNYVRNSKDRLLIAARITEDDEEKQQMSTNRGKTLKGKQSGHKNNYKGK